MKHCRETMQFATAKSWRRTFAILLFFGLFVITGCSSQDYGATVSTEQAKLVNTHVVNDPGGWQWLDLSRRQFHKLHRRDDASPENSPRVAGYRASHPIAQRLQFWVTTLHEELLERYPEELRNVVHPKVKLMHNGLAWVGYVETLNRVPISNPGGEKKSSSISYLSDDLFQGIDEESASFVRELPTSMHPYLQNVGASGDCVLNWDFKLDPAGSMAGDCSGGAKNLQGVVSYTAGGWISVALDVLELLENEEEMVVVLAHEMAHYYGANANFRHLYNYSYHLDHHLLGARPPSQGLLGKKVYDEQLRLASHLADHRVYVDYEFPGPLFDTMSEMIAIARKAGPKMCPEDRCKKACEGIEKIKSTWYIENLSTNEKQFNIDYYLTGGGTLDKLALPGGKEFMQDYNRAVEVCLKSAFVGDRDEFFATQYASKLGNDLRKSLTKTTYPHLWDLLLDFKKGYDRQVAAAYDALHTLEKKRFGIYTDEQEADEKSIQWISYLGIDPRWAASALSKLGRFVAPPAAAVKTIQRYSSYFGPSQKECQSLREKGWKDHKGNPVHVTIGGIHDPHHSTCFRVFNLDRLLKTNGGLEFDPSNKPKPPGKPWGELRQMAIELLKDPDLEFLKAQAKLEADQEQVIRKHVVEDQK